MNVFKTRRHGIFGQGESVRFAVAFAAGLGMLLLGYDQGLMSGLIGTEGTPFTITFNNPDSTMLGLMVAIYEVGCFIGALFILLLGERFGRRICMLAGGTVMLIGATMQTAAPSMGVLIAGRIVTGLGNGANFSTIPTWASEISGHDERGWVAAFNGWLIIWGVVIAYWVDYGCSTYQNDKQFRFPIALQMVFCIAMMALVCFLPESPRWLISRGRDQEAKEVLTWITPKAKKEDTDNQVVVQKEYERIVATREYEQTAEGDFSIWELFHGGSTQNWRRMLICFGIMACQQLSGTNLLTYYITYVLEQSIGLDHHMALLIGGFEGLEYLVASAIPMWTIERIGRRKLLLFSAAGQTASMAILAGAIWYVTERKDGPAVFSMGVLAVACFFLFNTFYAQGFLAIPFFYPAEITNLRTRSRGVAISIASNWIFNFLIVMITPVCTANIGYRTYILFAVLNLAVIPVVYFFFPETAGLSLEALDSLFDCPGITRGVLNKPHRRRMLEISRELFDGTPETNEEGVAYKVSTEHVEEKHA